MGVLGIKLPALRLQYMFPSLGTDDKSLNPQNASTNSEDIVVLNANRKLPGAIDLESNHSDHSTILETADSSAQDGTSIVDAETGGVELSKEAILDASMNRTDPLSIHIFKRTGTDVQLPRKHTASSIAGDASNPSLVRRASLAMGLSGQVPKASAGSISASSSSSRIPPSASPATSLPEDLQPKPKRKSLFSRIRQNFQTTEFQRSMQSGTVSPDTDMELPSGIETPLSGVYSSDKVAYVPQYAEAPKYIRVHSHGNVRNEIDRIFVAQELNYRRSESISPLEKTSSNHSDTESNTNSDIPLNKSGAIWCLKFSNDGRYLAIAGEDRVVRIWEVISNAESRAENEKEEDYDIPDNSSIYSGQHKFMNRHRKQRINAPVFYSKPVREFVGHKADVLDISWSKNNFLLSSSMDKTVRLWHVSRDECLCCFQHEDFVTSIAFHPHDDRFFLSGSLDCRLRLWSIPEKMVVYWNELPDLITAATFSNDGKIAIAGTFTGHCFFYKTEGLQYQSQLHVRSSRGQNSKGSKITGIEVLKQSPGSLPGDVCLLITSNDSRIRLYNIRDKSISLKLKGNENVCSQIRATASTDSRYVICGSEDDKIYIWDISQAGNESIKYDKKAYQTIKAHSTTVTEALFAPRETIELLSLSGDPIYDVCSPPPVRLASTDSDKHLSSQQPPESSMRQPIYHNNGFIIISADRKGVIKVLRRDCAYEKRVQNEEAANLLLKVVNSASFSASSSMTNIAKTLSRSSSRPSGRQPSNRQDQRKMSRSTSRGATTTQVRSTIDSTLSMTSGQPHESMDSTAKSSNSPKESHTLLPEVRAFAGAQPGRPSFTNEGSNSNDNGMDDAHDLLSNSQNASPIDVYVEGEGDELKCSRCGGTNFKAILTQTGETKLACSQCRQVVK
ncbi:WD40-repeat-containing domain protein [Dipodascopsis uninucleata]